LSFLWREKNVEFQGPIASNVTYLYGDQTINVSFTALTSMELRNPNGFQIYFLIYLINKIPCE